VVVVVRRLKMEEVAALVVAVELVALLLVLVEQEIHQAHHQAKVVTVGLRLHTTAHHLLARAVAAVLAGQQRQMGQVRQAQRLVMVQTAQHHPLQVQALHTQVVAVVGVVGLIQLAVLVAVALVAVAVLVCQQLKWQGQTEQPAQAAAEVGVLTTTQQQ
jgi:hypothetical protein